MKKVDWNKLADQVIAGFVWTLAVGSSIIIIAAFIDTITGAPSI
jgi:hypothetical protein